MGTQMTLARVSCASATHDAGLGSGHDQRPSIGEPQGGGEVDRKADVARRAEARASVAGASGRVPTSGLACGCGGKGSGWGITTAPRITAGSTAGGLRSRRSPDAVHCRGGGIVTVRLVGDFADGQARGGGTRFVGRGCGGGVLIGIRRRRSGW